MFQNIRSTRCTAGKVPRTCLGGRQIAPRRALRPTSRCRVRRGFTLTELLVVISIIAFLASILIVALNDAREGSRVSRAKSQIAKINDLLLARYESYRLRAIPLRVDPVRMTNARNMEMIADNRYAAALRLNTIRELMRLELPDRKTDLLGPAAAMGTGMNDPRANIEPYPTSNPTPLFLPAVPSVANAYRNRVIALSSSATFSAGYSQWTEEHQGSECLYMILASMKDSFGTGLAFFRDAEIGDTDNDGMFEILDPWRTPIAFIRWPAGMRAYPGGDGVWGNAGDDDQDGIDDNATEAGWPNSDDVAPPFIQDVGAPDPFDPMRMDPFWFDNDMNRNNEPFALFPLVVSAGSDTHFDIFNASTAFRYADQSPPNHPYVFITGKQIGLREDDDGDGEEYQDNIDNHLGVQSE